MTPRVLLSDVQGHREILSEYTQLGVEGWFDSRTPAALARALSSATSGAFCEAHLRLRSENAREVARRLWAERVESWLRSVSAELSTRR